MHTSICLSVFSCIFTVDLLALFHFLHAQSSAFARKNHTGLLPDASFVLLTPTFSCMLRTAHPTLAFLLGVYDYSQFRFTQLISLLLVSLTSRLHDLPGLCTHLLNTLFWGASRGVGGLEIGMIVGPVNCLLS